MSGKKVAYVDITKEWIAKYGNAIGVVAKSKYFQSKNGKKYFVDGKKVIINHSKEELYIANWLTNIYNNVIYLLPRINVPEGISTADYFFADNYWDYKQINGDKKHTIDSSIKKKENQAHNFIIDISRSNIDLYEAIRQIEKIYQNKDRKWVEKIILKDKNTFKIYNKKD